MYLATCNTILLPSIAMLILTQIFEFSNKSTGFIETSAFYVDSAKS